MNRFQYFAGFLLCLQHKLLNQSESLQFQRTSLNFPDFFSLCKSCGADSIVDPNFFAIRYLILTDITKRA